MLLDLVKNDKGLDKQMVMVCQFLCIFAAVSLAMSEKGVTIGECWFLSVVFVGITGNCVVGQGFFMLLMIRCSGYARANRMRVTLLSSSCRMWSSEMIMLYRSAWE